MRRNLWIVVTVVAVLTVIGVGAFAFVMLSGGGGEASGPITAEQLVAEADSQVVFRIDQAQSQVRFILDELLRGEPTTVIGITDQVAGDILVDFTDPAASSIGPIRINARTLATDNSLRDRASRGQILQSSQDAFEFVEFAPTALQGLPETVTIGQPINFVILGDLTVRETSGAVQFEATVIPVSEDRLEGTARGTIMRVDYNLAIPNVPGVANVSEEVILEIDFVALAIQPETE